MSLADMNKDARKRKPAVAGQVSWGGTGKANPTGGWWRYCTHSIRKAPQTRGSNLYLFKLSRRRKLPRNTKCSPSANQFSLLGDRWPPAHKVMCFIPIRLPSPMLSQTKYWQPTLTEGPLFHIPLYKPILRNYCPTSFITEHTNPGYIAGIGREFVSQRNNKMSICFGQLVQCSSQSWREVIVQKKLQAAFLFSNRTAASTAAAGIS